MALDDSVLKSVLRPNRRKSFSSAILNDKEAAKDNSESRNLQRGDNTSFQVTQEEIDDKTEISRYKVYDKLPHSNASKTSNLVNNIKKQIGEFTQANNPHGFISLVGLQKAMVLFIYRLCKNSRSKTTDPIAMEYLAASCKSTKASVRRTIIRLEQKQVIKKATSKIGRGGWTSFELPDRIYQEILTLDEQGKLFNILHGENKFAHFNLDVGHNDVNHNNINDTSSSSSVNALPQEWQKIDYSILSKYGFTQEHLFQLYKLNRYSTSEVQNSIYHFAFDLENNGKKNDINTSPINYFMGILRKNGPYLAPENYESPKDKAMRLYLEREKSKKEAREKMEKEAFDCAFNNWYAEQDESFIKSVVAQQGIPYKGKESAFTITVLRTLFKNDVWNKMEIEAT